MKQTAIAMCIILSLSACGSGDTGEGYKADTTSLNEIQD
jgi:hypothetical protein